LPELPCAWVSILGEPSWRVEWVAPDGKKQTADFLPAINGDGALSRLEIEIPVTWTSPVTAWPYWSNLNLFPGAFKPAGALFPFDVSGDYLLLSWEAGPCTVFYWELALAYNKNAPQNTVRIPANFDWQRFRELFLSETLSEAIREDPWLVNWRSFAERTVLSGFDRRRLVPQTAESITLPISEHLRTKWQGHWYGTSPFAKPLFFKDGELPVFPVLEGLNVWVSAEGLLKVSGNSWMFTAWEHGK